MPDERSGVGDGARDREMPLLPQHAGDGPTAPYMAGENTEAFGSGRGVGSRFEAFGTGGGKKDKSKKGDGKKEGEGTATEDDEDQDAAERGKDEEGEDDQGESKKDKHGRGDDGEKKPKKPPLYKRPAFWITGAIVLLVLVVTCIALWLYMRQYVWTDDAYIDGHVTQIAPQISAPVKVLHIDDNTYVKKGDLMVELDTTDYEVALEQAKTGAEAMAGKLAQARTQVGSAEANVQQGQAEIDAAQVQVENTARDLKRYQDVDPRARSQQQLDNAEAAAKNAAAQLEQAAAKKRSAEANVETALAAVTAAKGDLDKALADQRKAEVNLGYCRIVAPMDGRVTSRTIEPGSYVTTGQAMFALVSPDVWVTANYKETQLTQMKVGQPVRITVDAFPGHTFSGHIDSIQAGSGSRFSVLPAENATGNFVKIVQRVPVKIVFEHGGNTDDSHLLSPGLSARPRVTVRGDGE